MTHIRTQAYGLATLICSALTAVPMAALAQTAPRNSQLPSAQGTGDTGTAPALEEIVVTAQSREERLQEVPIQVTAFSAKMIEDAGIRSTADAIQQTANITFDRGNTYNSSFITARGLTQINNADPPVAVVIDGVPQTNQKQVNVAIFDAERIEVLKGPQGSLYGRNAVGGAINIVTKAPTNALEGFTDLSYGNGSTLNATGGLSGPLVPEALFFRVSATYANTDGLIPNTFRGDDVDFINHDYTVRGRLLYDGGGPLKIDLRGDYNNFRAGSNYYSYVASGSPNQVLDPQFNLPSYTVGSNGNATLKVDYDLKFSDLIAISSYSRVISHSRQDVDFRNPVDNPKGFEGLGFGLGGGQDEPITLKSQELRLISKSGQPFRWLLGTYYIETVRTLRTRAFVDLDGSYDQLSNPALVLVDTREADDNDAYAFFGQADYDIARALTVTAGLRYDKDNRHTTDVADGTVRAKSFDHLQPKLTLTWKPVADQLLYASFGTGFRSGGFNAPGAPVDGFQAETLKNFEAGFKSQWFERTLTLNGAAFYTKVDNYQFFYVAQDPVTLAPSQVISNIAKVHIKGLELEVAALPMRGLQLALAVGYTDTIIDRSLIVSDEGNHVPRNMPFEATSSVQYRGPVSNTLSVFGRLELQYDSKKYWAPDNVSVQDGYTMLNARLGLERGDIGLYVFGKNLTNVATYSEYFDPKYSGSDISFGYHNPPRSYGVELKMKFGR